MVSSEKRVPKSFLATSGNRKKRQEKQERQTARPFLDLSTLVEERT
jgi:hypothetical protein